MVAKKINELKKEKKLTNQKLAELSGVPIGTLNKITSGITTDPKLETLKALAKALNCRLDDFDDICNSYSLKTKSSIKESKLLINFNKLNDLGKDKAIERVTELTEIDKYIEEKKARSDEELRLIIKLAKEEDLKTNSEKEYIAALGGGLISLEEAERIGKILKEEAKPVPKLDK